MKKHVYLANIALGACPIVRVPMAIVALTCVLMMGCSDAGDVQPAAADGPEATQVAAPVALEDGVYPVVAADEAARGDRGSAVVALASVPVDRSEASAETIYVLARPLLKFHDVSQFDFRFEGSECTEVGFENTDELRAYTRDHVGSRLAVVIGNRAITHHKIREPIESANVRITCCTVGGGDHLHRHLNQIKLSADTNRQSR
jgi:hypothetical protein